METIANDGSDYVIPVNPSQTQSPSRPLSLQIPASYMTLQPLNNAPQISPQLQYILSGPSQSSSPQKPLPPINRGRQPRGQIERGRTIGTNKTRSKNIAKNNEEANLTDADLDKGILSLQERQLVPRNADFTPAFQLGSPPLVAAPAVIRPAEEKYLASNIHSAGLHETAIIVRSKNGLIGIEEPYGLHLDVLDRPPKQLPLGLKRAIVKELTRREKKEKELLIEDMKKRKRQAKEAKLNSNLASLKTSSHLVDSRLNDLHTSTALVPITDGNESNIRLPSIMNKIDYNKDSNENGPTFFTALDADENIEDGDNQNFMSETARIVSSTVQSHLNNSQIPKVNLDNSMKVKGKFVAPKNGIAPNRLQPVHIATPRIERSQIPSAIDIAENIKDNITLLADKQFSVMGNSVGFEIPFVKGLFLTESASYKTLKNLCGPQRWGAALQMLRRIEIALHRAGIVHAMALGKALFNLVSDEVESTPPSLETLLSLVRDSEGNVMNVTYGKGTKVIKGVLADQQVQQTMISAVVYIQSYWRMLKAKRLYNLFRELCHAATQLQMKWKCSMAHRKTKKLLVGIREEQKKKFEAIQEKFEDEWNTLCHRPRLEIHVLSSPLPDHRKKNFWNWVDIQSSQLARVFRVSANQKTESHFGSSVEIDGSCAIDVIIVTSTPVADEIQEYLKKILTFRGIENSNARIEFMSCSIFKKSNLIALDSVSTSLALWASHKTLQKLRKISRGRNAVIIPQKSTVIDALISQYTGIPLLAPNPYKKYLFESKSSIQKLISLSGVLSPPTYTNIMNREELLKTFARALFDYGDRFTCWIIKIDNEELSRGHCVVDFSSNISATGVSHGNDPSSVIQSLLVKTRAGLWTESDAIKALCHLITRAAPAFCKMPHPHVYQGWLGLMAEVDTCGCILQAVPSRSSVPNGSISRPIENASAHIFVAPNKHISVNECTEAIGASDSFNNGPVHAIPAAYSSCIQPVNDAARQVGRALSAIGLIGHFSIDFIVFEEKVLLTNKKTISKNANAADLTEGNINTKELSIIPFNPTSGKGNSAALLAAATKNGQLLSDLIKDDEIRINKEFSKQRNEFLKKGICNSLKKGPALVNNPQDMKNYSLATEDILETPSLLNQHMASTKTIKTVSLDLNTGPEAVTLSTNLLADSKLRFENDQPLLSMLTYKKNFQKSDGTIISEEELNSLHSSVTSLANEHIYESRIVIWVVDIDHCLSAPAAAVTSVRCLAQAESGCHTALPGANSGLNNNGLISPRNVKDANNSNNTPNPIYVANLENSLKKATLKIRPDAQAVQEEALEAAGRSVSFLPVERIGLFISGLHFEGLKKHSIGELFVKAKKHGCSFDLLNCVGAAFVAINRRGLYLNPLVVHVSKEHALKKLGDVLQFLSNEAPLPSELLKDSSLNGNNPMSQLQPLTTIPKIQDTIRGVLKYLKKKREALHQSTESLIAGT